MKAIVYNKYGSTKELKLEEVEKPTPTDNEVLVKVKASSINSWDWDLVRGKPYIVRMGGLFKPAHQILGCDIAGMVESVGKEVKELKAGDEVFGDVSGYKWGGFAEYVCVRKDLLAIKSASMTFEEAAATPQAGVLALQGLLKYGEIKEGQKILFNGAGGGVGTYAIQMAKAHGAEITAVDKGDKLKMLTSTGADHVIDYEKEDFTKSGRKYDLILDVVVNHSSTEYKNILEDSGKLVMIGGDIPRIFKYAFLDMISFSKNGKKLGILAHQPNKKDLDTLTELYENENVRPVIDRCYSLQEVPEAIEYLGRGQAKGKLVIKM